MKKNEFVEKLKDALEIDANEEITEETNLRDLAEYDSLGVLIIIAMVDENFGKQLTAQQFADVTTIKSLIERIGKEFFKE